MKTTFPHLAEVLQNVDKVLHKSHKSSAETIHSRVTQTLKKVKTSKPYEPVLWHSLNYLEFNETFENPKSAREHLFEKTRSYGQTINSSKAEATFTAALRMPQGGVVATRGDHDLVSCSLLHKESKQKKLKINIVGNPHKNTLTKSRKKSITTYSENAARQALKNADILLLGCSVITPDHIVAEMGTELLVELANNQKIPVYFVSVGHQFDEGWEKNIRKLPNFKRTTVSDHDVRKHRGQYEFVEPERVKGIISELGIYPHYQFVNEVKQTYPWLFKK
jgi:translation initiation factor 2B subunit (eIF-2B alpha/beta/delta family)